MKRRFFLDRHSYNLMFKEKYKNNDFFFKRDPEMKYKKILNYSKDLKDYYFSKNVYISEIFLGSRVFVQFGKEISSIKIMPKMIGYKLGEFFFGKRAFKKMNIKLKKKKIKS